MSNIITIDIRDNITIDIAEPTTTQHYCPDYPQDELIGPCDCDKCSGACNNGNGGKCGECFACEELDDNARFWEANRSDILGI